MMIFNVSLPFGHRQTGSNLGKCISSFYSSGCKNNIQEINYQRFPLFFFKHICLQNIKTDFLNPLLGDYYLFSFK